MTTIISDGRGPCASCASGDHRNHGISLGGICVGCPCAAKVEWCERCDGQGMEPQLPPGECTQCAGCGRTVNGRPAFEQKVEVR